MEHANKKCLEVLRDHLQEVCNESGNGKWLDNAKETLRRNNVEVADFL